MTKIRDRIVREEKRVSFREIKAMVKLVTEARCLKIFHRGRLHNIVENAFVDGRVTAAAAEHVFTDSLWSSPPWFSAMHGSKLLNPELDYADLTLALRSQQQSAVNAERNEFGEWTGIETLTSVLYLNIFVVPLGNVKEHLRSKNDSSEVAV